MMAEPLAARGDGVIIKANRNYLKSTARTTTTHGTNIWGEGQMLQPRKNPRVQ